MKYDITVDGGHKAVIEITPDGKGGFAGSVTSPDYGTGTISNGVMGQGGTMAGSVSLDGYDADFSAAVVGDIISGTLSYGWFFKKAFSGKEIPS